jgi:rubrerythrin
MAERRDRGHGPRDQAPEGTGPEERSRDGAPERDRAAALEGEGFAVEISPAELLTSLARLDLEAALAYETAAELSAERDVARQLGAFAKDHRRHVDALNRILAREDEPTVSAGGGAVPVLPGIMKLAGPLGPEVIVVALLGNEQLTNLSYDGALAYQWDEDVETLLQGFAADEQRHLGWLVERHDRVSGHAASPDPSAT